METTTTELFIIMGIINFSMGVLLFIQSREVASLRKKVVVSLESISGIYKGLIEDRNHDNQVLDSIKLILEEIRKLKEKNR